MVFYVILAILLVGLLVMVHEFGHFIAARLCGIAVKEFSIGFGPKLFQRTAKKTGMLFTLRLIPMGGYCMFYGDTDDDPTGEKTVDDPRDYTKQPVWKRMISVVSGPLMNFVLALIAAILMLLIYYVPINPYIATVSENTPAYEAGLQPGDEFVKIGDTDVDGAMSQAITETLQQEANTNGVIRLTLRRAGRELQFEVKPVFDITEQRYLMGIGVQGPLPLGQVVPEAFRLLGKGSVAIIEGLKSIFSTPEGFNEAAGVIGMVRVVAVQTQSGGFEVFLYLMVIISINLGLINLLPIPGLDGSRIIFMLIEAIRRKPVSQKIESTIHLVGYVLLFGLMIVLVFKDVGRIFGA